MTDTRPDLVDVVNELTRPVHHDERYEVERRNRDGSKTFLVRHHGTVHPSLIGQLEQACHQAAVSLTDEGGRPGYLSKPTARIDAIDTLLRIDQEASKWLRDLAHRSSRELSTTDLILEVNRLRDKGSQARAIERSLRSWWVWARILSGWDSPAWRPDNSCPACSKRGGLRVRLSVQSAICVECRAEWEPATIGLLADHIRAENHDEATSCDTPTVVAS